MIIAFTGHRPDRLQKMDLVSIVKQTNEALKSLTPTKVIVGMARGYDLLAADIALNLGIPVVCAIPFSAHQSQEETYMRILQSASERHIISSGPYAKWMFAARDRWMVDHADAVIAAFDGMEVGGTWLTVKYALSKGKTVFYVGGASHEV